MGEAPHRPRPEELPEVEQLRADVLSRLLGEVTHFFNNKLTTVLGNADLAQEELEPDTLARECVEEIASGGQHAADICRDVLACTGRRASGPAVINPGEMLARFHPVISIAIGKRTEIETDLAPDAPIIACPQAELRQLILAIVRCAADAVRGSDAKLGLTARAMALPGSPAADGGDLAIEVALLPGRSQEIGREICRVDRARLAGRPAIEILRPVAEALDAQLEVTEDDRANQIVRLCLPGRDRQKPTGVPALADAIETARDVVLLVDDDPTIRFMGKRLLEKLEYEAITAEDGPRALALVRERADEIACILLDLTLPGMQGSEVLNAARSIRADMPIVICSGISDAEAAAQVGEAERVYFMMKPYRQAPLQEALDKALGAKRE